MMLELRQLSDNAPGLNLHDFYQTKGIMIYRSCRETPEQNAVVECKHQHILNVGQALLIQLGITLP